jgi:hypothetical protein
MASRRKVRANPVEESEITQRYDAGKFLQYSVKNGKGSFDYKSAKAGEIGGLSATGAQRRLTQTDAAGNLVHPDLQYNTQYMVVGTTDDLMHLFQNPEIWGENVMSEAEAAAEVRGSINAGNVDTNEYIQAMKAANTQRAAKKREEKRALSPLAVPEDLDKVGRFNLSVDKYLAQRKAVNADLAQFADEIHSMLESVGEAPKKAGGRRASPRASKSLFEKLAALPEGNVIRVSVDKNGKLVARPTTRPNMTSAAVRYYEVPAMPGLLVKDAATLRRLLAENNFLGDVEAVVAEFDAASLPLYQERAAKAAAAKAKSPKSPKSPPKAASPRNKSPLVSPVSPARSASPVARATTRFGRR